METKWIATMTKDELYEARQRVLRMERLDRLKKVRKLKKVKK